MHFQELMELCLLVQYLFFDCLNFLSCRSSCLLRLKGVDLVQFQLHYPSVKKHALGLQILSSWINSLKDSFKVLNQF